MAGRIKGITVEIGGDTTGLEKALELTYRCNHQCIFCSCPWESDEKYRKDELSTAECGTVSSCRSMFL